MKILKNKIAIIIIFLIVAVPVAAMIYQTVFQNRDFRYIVSSDSVYRTDLKSLELINKLEDKNSKYLASTMNEMNNIILLACSMSEQTCSVSEFETSTSVIKEIETFNNEFSKKIIKGGSNTKLMMKQDSVGVYEIYYLGALDLSLYKNKETKVLFQWDEASFSVTGKVCNDIISIDKDSILFCKGFGLADLGTSIINNVFIYNQESGVENIISSDKYKSILEITYSEDELYILHSEDDFVTYFSSFDLNNKEDRNVLNIDGKSFDMELSINRKFISLFSANTSGHQYHGEIDLKNMSFSTETAKGSYLSELKKEEFLKNVNVVSFY